MRIVIVVNKWWECEPAINAMLNSNACPPSAPWPNPLNSPQAPLSSKPPAPTPQTIKPRAVFDYGKFTAEVWCISDLMNDVPGNLQSSSQVKAERLPLLFPADAARPDLVIAVGTAGSALEEPNRAGGVAIGGQVFVHNAHPPSDPNPLSKWTDPRAGKVIPSTITTKFFEQIAAFDAASALLHFMTVRRNPSDSPIVTIGLTDTALGTLNVSAYGEYKFKDRETVAAFDATGSKAFPASVETTHGLIRLASDPAPFLFLTTITDQFLHFDAQVGPTPLADAQNTAAAYNAGVTLRWMLAGLLGNLP